MTTNYIDGAEGFISWCEENVCLPVFHKGESVARWTLIGELPEEYTDMWAYQCEVFRQALRMIDGRFVHRLIVFCWPRGEGKSYIACLIQLWKFFNFVRQQIMLGANSKDQVKFVHFEVMKDIIVNSPNLLRKIGKKNIQEKEIRIKDSKGNVVSLIRSVSSFSGIFSNITGYTFSEMFDMNNHKFFVQLDGSIRNIPNAFGVIDSTVSSKQHVLYKLYKAYEAGEDETLFFHYRFSQKGDPKDYWNPNMTQAQLTSYKAKFPMGDFERYFLNLWSAGSEKLFTSEIVHAMYYFGADHRFGNQHLLIEILKSIKDYTDNVDRINTKMDDQVAIVAPLENMKNRLWPVKSYYTLRDKYSKPTMCSMEALMKLSDLLDTDWAIMAGVDRADPMKSGRTQAKTIVSIIAKGLQGSRSSYISIEEGSVPHYIYFLLHLVDVPDDSLEGIKDVLSETQIIYSGIDTLCAERWGMWDIANWCEENDIAFESIYPNYDKQKMCFTELYTILRDGRFKSPPVGVSGTKTNNIIEEEALIFDHDSSKRWFGSPEKKERYGTQDDSIYSIGWGIYGGRELGIDDFKERFKDTNFGTFVKNESLIGAY